jgi:hypothetical protein
MSYKFLVIGGFLLFCLSLFFGGFLLFTQRKVSPASLTVVPTVTEKPVKSVSPTLQPFPKGDVTTSF